jgi:uncharacterized protein (TIGR00730 family)
LKRICVFSGSRMGSRPIYQQAAAALGQAMARQGLELVYGGASVGLMGVLADTILAAGGRVTGVIPQFLVDKEIAHPNLSELHVVESMHQRKALMASLSDGFVALPGGFGTLEEFCEVLTWAQMRLHDRPCGLLNIEGFYDPLIQMFDQALQQQFLRPEHRQLVLAHHEPAALLQLLATHPGQQPARMTQS